MSGFWLKLEKETIFDDELIERQTFYNKLKYVYKTKTHEPQCLCFQNI